MSRTFKDRKISYIETRDSIKFQKENNKNNKIAKKNQRRVQIVSNPNQPQGDSNVIQFGTTIF